MEKNKIHYKKAKYPHHSFHCPYCEKELTYVWYGNIMFGLALDKWVYCSKCKKYFKLGSYGFREYELNLSSKRR